MLVLHGIFGSGANWRTFARRLAEARPSWGFVLVDLRMHGQSQGAPPPHTLATAAEDLSRLATRLGLPIGGVLGHSFGGKVALAFLASTTALLDQAWVLDANPGPTRPEGASTTEAVLETLRALAGPLASREAFVEAVVARGHTRAIAEWLAMNVRRADDGLVLRLDLGAMEAMLEAYRAADLWPVVVHAKGTRALHVVVGGRSDTFGPPDRERLARIAAREPRVHAHVIPEAGHWLHVDAPDALFDLVHAALS